LQLVRGPVRIIGCGRSLNGVVRRQMESEVKRRVQPMLMILSWIGFVVVTIGTIGLITWVQHYYATTHHSAPNGAKMAWLTVLLVASWGSAAISVSCIATSLTKTKEMIAAVVAFVLNLAVLFWLNVLYAWA
jgi:magnesium-transporting ATPase (P-type)